jgi:hypothetical protein
MARIAAGLGKLRTQIQAVCPRAPKDEFGWIASATHSQQNPNSDHEPDSRGIVHALDVPHYPELGLDCAILVQALLDSKDPRIRYVIWAQKIFGDEGYGRRNGRSAWTKYAASDHTEHAHVSINVANEDDASEWSIGKIGDTKPGEPPPPQRPLLRQGSTGDAVRLVQELLMTDGIFGPATELAVRRFQREQGDLAVDGVVGPATWRRLELLLKPVEPGAWQIDITATEFGGAGDEQPSAYADVAAGWPNRLGVSLPDRFNGVRPRVEVVNAGGKSATCPIVDVGPWLIDDPYWALGTRPQAETAHKAGKPLESGPNKSKVPTNAAGIDLTPATARELGINGKGIVKWRLVTS